MRAGAEGGAQAAGVVGPGGGRAARRVLGRLGGGLRGGGPGLDHRQDGGQLLGVGCPCSTWMGA